MKTPQTEAGTVEMIDRYNVERLRLVTEAADLDHLADCLRTTVESNRISGLRERADNLRSRASWRETRVKNLGDHLAEIRTIPLPFTENEHDAKSQQEGAVPKV